MIRIKVVILCFGEFGGNKMGRLIDAHDFWARLPRNAENITLADITEALGGTPTVDAEPVRHGQWVGLEYDGYADGNPVYDLWECSLCNCEWDGEEDTLPHYCPDCGAKMDGEING